MDTPPEIAIEQAELARELGIVERAMSAPNPSFVEELGTSGRFATYYSELRRANDAIALLGERLDSFAADSQEWRVMHRQWLILIGIVVVIILVAVAVLSTVLVLHGGP